MAFVNEFIQPKDKSLLRMAPSPHFFRAGKRCWTADHERRIYLLYRGGGGPEAPPRQTDWAFLWHDCLLDVRLLHIDSGVDADARHGWKHVRVVSLGSFGRDITGQKQQILRDLKEALTIHAGLGIDSYRTSYELTLEDQDGFTI